MEIQRQGHLAGLLPQGRSSRWPQAAYNAQRHVPQASGHCVLVLVSASAAGTTVVSLLFYPIRDFHANKTKNFLVHSAKDTRDE